MGQAKRKYVTKYQCEIEGCTRPAGKAVGLCDPCYAADLYWAKKTVAQRRKRAKNLAIFANRMETFTPKLRSVK